MCSFHHRLGNRSRYNLWRRQSRYRDFDFQLLNAISTSARCRLDEAIHQAAASFRRFHSAVLDIDRKECDFLFLRFRLSMTKKKSVGEWAIGHFRLRERSFVKRDCSRVIQKLISLWWLLKITKILEAI